MVKTLVLIPPFSRISRVSRLIPSVPPLFLRSLVVQNARPNFHPHPHRHPQFARPRFLSVFIRVHPWLKICFSNFPSKTQCLFSKIGSARLIIPFAHKAFLVFHPPKTDFVSQKQKIFKKSAFLFPRNKLVFPIPAIIPLMTGTTRQRDQRAKTRAFVVQALVCPGRETYWRCPLTTRTYLFPV